VLGPDEGVILRLPPLRIEAARQSPLYFDLMISLSKSLSIFHASRGRTLAVQGMPVSV
jgi:hypothetical protein